MKKKLVGIVILGLVCVLASVQLAKNLLADDSTVNMAVLANDSYALKDVEYCEFPLQRNLSEPVAFSEAVDESYFNDAVFIGDSRVAGFDIGHVLENTTRTAYAAVSLDLNKVFTKQVIQLDNGNYGTVFDALAQHSFGKVYISFGLNELGWGSMEVFEQKYSELIDQVRMLQPNAMIYLLGVYNFSASVNGENSYTTLDYVKRNNASILNVAQQKGVYYIDSNAMLGGSDVFLPEEWSNDGYHLNQYGYNAWVEMLKTHVEKGEIEYETKPCNL